MTIGHYAQHFTIENPLLATPRSQKMYIGLQALAINNFDEGLHPGHGIIDPIISAHKLADLLIQRLDIITDPDIPAGHAVWMFDQSDMIEVKKKLGGWATFGGNVPASLLKTGTAQGVADYVKKLIEDVAGDGGFILANGAVLDDATAENVHAMIDTAKEYGIY